MDAEYWKTLAKGYSRRLIIAEKLVERLERELAECRDELDAEQARRLTCPECWDAVSAPGSLGGPLREVTVYLCQEHYDAALEDAKADRDLDWFNHFVEYLDIDISMDCVQFPMKTVEAGVDTALQQARKASYLVAKAQLRAVAGLPDDTGGNVTELARAALEQARAEGYKQGFADGEDFQQACAPDIDLHTGKPRHR